MSTLNHNDLSLVGRRGWHGLDWMGALTFSSAFVFCFSCFYSLLDCSLCPSCSLSFLDFLSPHSLTLVSFSLTLFVCMNGCTCVCSRLRPTPFDPPSLSSAWYGSGMDMDNYGGDDWGVVDTIARKSLAQQKQARPDGNVYDYESPPYCLLRRFCSSWPSYSCGRVAL